MSTKTQASESQGSAAGAISTAGVLLLLAGRWQAFLGPRPFKDINTLQRADHEQVRTVDRLLAFVRALRRRREVGEPHDSADIPGPQRC